MSRRLAARALLAALVGVGCGSLAGPPGAPRREFRAPHAVTEVSTRPAEAPRMSAISAADSLAELRAAFAEARDLAPAPAVELPGWLAQGTLWFALADGCRPLYRHFMRAPEFRYTPVCEYSDRSSRRSCAQDFEVGREFIDSMGYSCSHSPHPPRSPRIGRGGGGGWSENGSNLVFPDGRRYDGGETSFVQANGLRHIPPVYRWAPIAASAEHVVYAELWELSLRDESRARVEQTCAPGSSERAASRIAAEMPGAGPQALAAALASRHGVGADGLRRCVVRGDERLYRDRRLPDTRFGSRIRNVRTEDIVDCAEPCHEDEARYERLQAFLAATRFVAATAPRTLVVYRSRVACEAGTTRSSLRFTDEACRRDGPRRTR